MDPRTDAEVIACSCTSPASFGELFDRHATTMFRYFVRRVGPDDADSLLGSCSASRSRSGRRSTPRGRRRARGCRASRATSWPAIDNAMPIEDGLYGYRRYEADDLEGHHWHFHESLEAIRARERSAD